MRNPRLAADRQEQAYSIVALRSTRANSHLITRPVLLIIVLAVFALTLARLDHESLWADEAWSIWAASGSWTALLSRVAGDVHPPLYFVLLKGWIGLAGDSVFAARWLSAAFGMAGLTITAAVGRRLGGEWLAVGALLWLGTHGFLLYYLREVRMYSLLFALAAFSFWVYGQWLRRPSPGKLAAYAMTTASLVYLHYFAPLVVIAQGLHLAWVAPRRLAQWVAANGLALLIYIPWLPTMLAQAAAHPGGPHQRYTPTDWPAIGHLAWVISGGAGWWLLALVGVVLSRNRDRPAGYVVMQLAFWCLLPPVMMMAANAMILPVYEPRNVITMLPALGLLVAMSLQSLRRPLLIVGALSLLVAINLAASTNLRPAKPDWAGAFETVLERRSAEMPILLKIVEPASVEAYYAHTLPFKSAATIDLPAQPVAASTMRTLVNRLPSSTPVWAILPANIAESWAALEQLSRHRHVTLRRSVEYMLFYRFDAGEVGSLRFAFGDYLNYASQQIAVPHVAHSGASRCFALRLAVRKPLAGAFSYGLHLVDPAGRLVAQVDAGLGDPPVGAAIKLAPCLRLPAHQPPGDYAAHLVIYRWGDGVRLPVLESGVNWGDALVVGVVEVQPDAGVAGGCSRPASSKQSPAGALRARASLWPRPFTAGQVPGANS